MEDINESYSVNQKLLSESERKGTQPAPHRANKWRAIFKTLLKAVSLVHLVVEIILVILATIVLEQLIEKSDAMDRLQRQVDIYENRFASLNGSMSMVSAFVNTFWSTTQNIDRINITLSAMVNEMRHDLLAFKNLTTRVNDLTSSVDAVTTRVNYSKFSPPDSND